MLAPDLATVRISDLVANQPQSEKLDGETEYRLLGVRLEGRGAFHRETKLGASISASTLTRVHEGDFVYSRLFAWLGAFSLIGPDLDGCYVSNEFPVFRLDREKVDSTYLLWWLLRTETLRLVESECTGSTPLTRNRFKEKFFLDLKIPLPSLIEQKRIVAKVQEAFRALDRAATLHAQTVADFDRLLIALAHRDDLTEDQKRERGWRKLRLGDVMHLDLDPVKVDPSQDYPNLGIYSFAKGLFEKPPISGLATSATVLNRVKSGQFIFSRLFAFEGSYGYVSADFEGFYVSGEYPTFTCIPGECRAEFVYAHFKPERIWQSLSAKSKGLGLRRQRVQPPAILTHEAWVPPMPEQDRIAEVLSAQRRFAASDTFQKDADALRRSILSKAFRGQL